MRHIPLITRRVSRRPSAAVVGLIVAPLAAATLVSSPAAGADDPDPFRNPGLPLDQRIDDLMGRLTLDEKLGFLHQSQMPIPRLGIPYFKAGTEALHGVAWSNDLDNNWSQVLSTDATVFPQALGLASTWDPELIESVGSAVGDELRAYNSLDPTLWGLQAWSPVVDLLRDPRWGRNEEGYSEDPYLTGTMATAYGSGLSGDDPFYLKVAPVLKHYFGYNKEANRSNSSSNLPPRVRKEYAQAPFRQAISADAATGIMASYNLVNGRPTHVDSSINDDVRSWTDKTLYNVSDAWAPHALTQAQFYFDAEDEAYAAVLEAGLDGFTVDESDPSAMIATLHSALDKGYITEDDVDTAVSHVLSVRFRLGHFDPDGGPYADIGPEELNSPEHQALNRQTATESMVLLSNDDGTLPLDPSEISSIAVVGPLHDELYSDWYGGSMPYDVTPLDGFSERLGSGADVTGVEGLDRVAFKDSATGLYLTATGTDANSDLVVGAAGPATAASQWDVNGWMADYSTLRNAEFGTYLTGAFGPYNTSSAEPSGWFVQQQFRIEEQDDGTVLIQYVGYETNESWWGIPGHYVTVAPDGTVGTGLKAEAARFELDVVSDGVQQAVTAASSADAAVVVVGSQPFVYGRENHDRTSLALGISQQELVSAVTEANPNTVVVLEASYPVTFEEQPDTLLWTTHAGSETGNALASLIMGDASPAGRLTQTWYDGTDDLPSIGDYDIIKSGWTYMYYDGEPLYPFGHGRSYTTFEYSKLKTSRAVGGNGVINVKVDVTNTGDVAGDEVVQLYSRQRHSRDVTANLQLRDFSRVSLDPGETATVRFKIRADDLAHWDVTRDRWVVESGRYDVLVGASSQDIRESSTVRVRGETIPPRDLSTATRAENFDGYSDGIMLVDETKSSGTSIGVDGSGEWLAFGGSRLGRHDRTFSARVSGGSGTIEVRLDSPNGRLLGTAEVIGTGNVYSYDTITTSLSRARGVQDVYLVLDGKFRLTDFSIS